MTTHTVSTTDELQQRTANADAGDEIVARDGTYEMTSRWTVRNGGSDGSPLVIRAADGEVPHITFDTSGEDSGVQFRSPYVHFRGFEVSGSSWKGVNADGDAHDVVFEDLDVHDSHLWGVMNNGCDDVVYRNCDSHHNNGNPNNSDGFNMTGPARNGLIEGCRSWANGDDGFDCWISEDHLIRNCWAWDNGREGGGTGDGFKLGGGPNRGGGHTIHNCVAFSNMRRGFDWNTTDNSLEVYNNTAISNPINYRFNQNGPYTLRNNISVNGDVELADDVDDQYNSWNLDISDPQFRSTDPGSADFLQLESSSPAIGAGTDVGLSFEGNAPDLGAFQFDGESDGGSEDESETTPSRITIDEETTVVARDATWNTESLFETEHAGFNGDGYVNFVPASGGNAQWALEIPEARTYNLEIRYANGGSGDRTANLTFAGDSQQITFPQTGGWATWETVSGTVDLPSGEVDLGIETTGQDAGNVDQIRLWPVESDEPRSEPTGDTENHGFNVPAAGETDWHVPVNENFEAMDRRIPVVDKDATKGEYTAAERALYIAVDTATVYVGDGAEWHELGSFG